MGEKQTYKESQRICAYLDKSPFSRRISEIKIHSVGLKSGRTLNIIKYPKLLYLDIYHRSYTIRAFKKNPSLPDTISCIKFL